MEPRVVRTSRGHVGLWVRVGLLLVVGYLVLAIVAAALGIVSPLVPAATAAGGAVGFVIALVGTGRPSVAASHVPQPAVRGRGRWIVALLAVLLVMFAVVTNVALFDVGGPNPRLLEADYSGTAQLAGSPEAWTLTETVVISADDLAGALRATALSGSDFLAEAAQQGWVATQVVGGELRLDRRTSMQAPQFGYTPLAQLSTISITRPMIAGTVRGGESLSIEPRGDSEFVIEGPAGSLNATRPGTAAATPEAGGTESRRLRLGLDAPASIEVEVVNPTWRNTPITHKHNSRP